MIRVTRTLELNAGRGFPAEQFRDAFELFGDRGARHYSLLLGPPEEDVLEPDDPFDSLLLLRDSLLFDSLPFDSLPFDSLPFDSLPFESLLLPASLAVELPPESACAAFL